MEGEGRRVGDGEGRKKIRGEPEGEDLKKYRRGRGGEGRRNEKRAVTIVTRGGELAKKGQKYELFAAEWKLMMI